MILFDKTRIYGWEAAVRGMRNPMNSWNRSDSRFDGDSSFIGDQDRELMKKLAKAGPVHGKYMRMITVTTDIIAPLYWWKEFDTYKVGTVRNSCSTMHKIAEKEFTLDDFSHEYLSSSSMKILLDVINALNYWRDQFLETKSKKVWWQMIQLLPSSYNQRSTVMLNYAVLQHIYPDRKDHKLDEWQNFCWWIRSLPYSELITGGRMNNVHNLKEVKDVIADLSLVILDREVTGETDTICRRALEQLRRYRNLIEAITEVSDEDH